MTTFTYWTLDPPAKWRAGFVGDGETKRAFFFGCADCGAKEPPIAAILSTDGTFAGIGIIKAPDGVFGNPAMFCATCAQHRMKKGTTS